METQAKVFCHRCGSPMTPQDRFCRRCGGDTAPGTAAAAPPAQTALTNASDRSRLAAALLCFFIGIFGAHRFYAGKIGTGLLWMFTLGLLTFGWLFDMILILLGEFKDAEGRKITRW